MSIFYADRYFERFEDVTVEILQKENVKLLLCDLDNTLKTRKDTEPDDELTNWVKELKAAGIRITVISNNGKKKKLKAFCRPLGIDCTWWSKKPFTTKLTDTMHDLGFPKEHTVMLGDKWSTDILAAKFAGVRAWKVEHRKKLLKDDWKAEKQQNKEVKKNEKRKRKEA